MNNSKKLKNTSKFNWGTGLAVVITLFILGTLGVVGFIISLDFHMVTENHYEKAVNYQEHIDRVKQTGVLDTPVEIVYRPGDGEIQVLFPYSLTEGKLNGVVELYRPSDSSQDQRTELSADEQGIHRISTQNLAAGKWLVKVTWTSEGREYYQQKNVYL